MSTTRRALAAAAALMLTIAACAGDEAGDTDVDGQPPAEAADDTADEATDEPAADDEATTDDADAGTAASVAVDNTDLGSVLVDAEGMTLYLFDPDEQGPSQCYEDCEANWPPLVTAGEPVAEGAADPELVGTVERDDGSLQVTYDGWPLYHFIGDQAPGDVAGQGVNDVWWVIDAEGEPVRNAVEEDDDGAGASY